jgi:hypothetical protein
MTHASIPHQHDVIQVQETRFARVAARSLRVGAYWFAEKEQVLDPTLFRPIELITAGFPFLSVRSLASTRHCRTLNRSGNCCSHWGIPSLRAPELHSSFNKLNQ